MREQREVQGSSLRPRGRLAKLRCVGCGYGVVAAIAPESCPICRSSVWEHDRRQHPRPPSEI